MLASVGLLCAGAVPVTEGYVTGADGVRLFYRRLGSGADFVVFLHGGPGLSHLDGGPQIEPIAERHTLIPYGPARCGPLRVGQRSRPAHRQRGARPGSAPGATRHREDEAGLSWGSGLAALYVQAHPDRVERIVFLDPMPPATRISRRSAARWTPSSFNRTSSTQPGTIAGGRASARCRPP